MVTLPLLCCRSCSRESSRRTELALASDLLVVPFLCPWQSSDVPGLWFAASDTLVSMTSLDFTYQRARVEAAGVRHEVDHDDDILHAASCART